MFSSASVYMDAPHDLQRVSSCSIWRVRERVDDVVCSEHSCILEYAVIGRVGRGFAGIGFIFYYLVEPIM
jgi:hypothetical protein